MRFLLRSDASATTGTGHVVRCLTLAEELRARRHEVTLAGEVAVPWLTSWIADLEVTHLPVRADGMEGVDGRAWDAVVVDSYRIPANELSVLGGTVPLLAIIDGDDRGITAAHYVDPNLGAEEIPRDAAIAARLSAGSRFALIRREIVRLRHADRAIAADRPKVLVVFGGTDPTGAALRVAGALDPLLARADITIVAAPDHAARLDSLIGGRARLLPPTPRLPAELDAADLVITAAGTGAWEVCTLGIPAVFAAVVPNQREGLARIVEGGLGLGVDASTSPQRIVDAVGLAVGLLDDADARAGLSARSLAAFDGLGAGRVADELERIAR
jgi:spore coat polysaccharide biosynthesis predicted glycosyltransferase SpsG